MISALEYSGLKLSKCTCSYGVSNFDTNKQSKKKSEGSSNYYRLAKDYKILKKKSKIQNQ